jgi:glutathione S-transferase
MKLETYLRMANLSYESNFINNPQQAPKGKLPYIQIDGVNYPDSELIIDALKKRYGDVLDKDLTAEQQALAVLLDNTFCERMYWVVAYMRWQNDAGWRVVKEGYFGKLPALPKLFFPSMIRKKTLKALYLQGNGRHSTDEIIQLGCKTMDAIAYILGEKPYFLGDKPSSIDATAFAFIANLLMSPVDDALKQYALQFDTIKAYCSRMWDIYYADFPKPTM